MAGRKIVVRFHNGENPGELVTIATLNSKSFSLNNEMFDDTADGSVDANDMLWEASKDGVASMSVSGDGRTRGTAGEQRLNAIFFSTDRAVDGEMVVPGVGTYSGNYRLESLEFGGETKGDSTFSFAMKSNGPITFVAEGA
jgi:TP901-1 family phage major tail protein